MKTIYMFLLALMFVPLSLAGQRVYRVEYESQADKKIYFVEYESQADLKIYKVKYQSQAGWKNKEKQHLLL
jgi:hypothetical protein